LFVVPGIVVSVPLSPTLNKLKYLYLSTAAPATKTHSLPLLAATLTKSVPLALEARLLTFQVESKARLEFLAGQFIRIEMKLKWKHRPAGVFHCFSSGGG